MAPPRDRVVTAAAFARPKLQLEHPLLYFRDEPLVVVRRGNAATARQFQADFKFSKRRKRRTDDIGSLPLTHSHGSIPEHLQCSGVGSAIIMNRAGPLLLGRLPGVTTTRTWPPALLSTELAFTGRVIG